MSSVEIRPVRQTDLSEFASAAVSSLTFEKDLTVDLLKLRIFDDPDFDPKLNLAAVSRGKIVSFIAAVHPVKSIKVKNRAWLKVFFTLEHYRRRGIASSLFRQILSELKRQGVKELRFSDWPSSHFTPGIDLNYEDGLDFLMKNGFEKDEEEVDYGYDLSKFYYPRRIARLKRDLAVSGIKTSLAAKREKQELTEWIGKHFSSFWKSEAEQALLRKKPIVAVARNKNSNILGFAACNGLAPGWFGPAGVDKAGRGKGIGTVLLFDAFDAMKKAGHKTATVHWTDHLFYYTQVPGLVGVRHFWIVRKTLS